MAVISVTEIGVFKRCRRLWHYQYKEQLAPISEAPHFYIGRMVHQVLAEWTQEPEKEIESIWAKVAQQEVDFYRERYLEVIGAKPSEAEINARMADALLPHHMIMNYQRHWQTPLPEGYVLVQPEQTCLVEIPGLTDVQLEATLDGLVVHLPTNRFYILERKTYENRPRIEVLESNEQFVAYNWVVSKLFPEYEVGGILYDGLWKRMEPPRKKTLEDLFFRHLLLKSEVELEDFESNLVKVAAEMVGSPAIYPNRTWQGCWDDSSYERLCTAQSKGDDMDDIKSTYFGKREKARWIYGEED